MRISTQPRLWMAWRIWACWYFLALARRWRLVGFMGVSSFWVSTSGSGRRAPRPRPAALLSMPRALVVRGHFAPVGQDRGQVGFAGGFEKRRADRLFPLGLWEVRHAVGADVFQHDAEGFDYLVYIV